MLTSMSWSLSRAQGPPAAGNEQQTLPCLWESWAVPVPVCAHSSAQLLLPHSRLELFKRREGRALAVSSLLKGGTECQPDPREVWALPGAELSCLSSDVLPFSPGILGGGAYRRSGLKLPVLFPWSRRHWRDSDRAV